MEKRGYTNINAFEKQILTMRAEGMTRRQIADALGLDISQIKNWVFRYNRRIKKQNAS